MTSAELIGKLREAFGPAIESVTEPTPNKVRVEVVPEAIVPVAKALYKEHGARFVVTAGIDSRAARGSFDVDHIFSLDKDKIFVIIRGIFLKGAGFVELWDETAALIIIGVIIMAMSISRFKKRLE